MASRVADTLVPGRDDVGQTGKTGKDGRAIGHHPRKDPLHGLDEANQVYLERRNILLQAAHGEVIADAGAVDAEKNAVETQCSVEPSPVVFH